MHIHGLQKLAMVDYPGKLAATVFTGGCNLRCPFCHNALLVTRLAETPEIPEQEVLDFLAPRRGLLDYVAMDVKNAPARYAETVGIPGFNPAPVEESIRLLRKSTVDYEFRTTLVRELHRPEDLDAIAAWLAGAPRYYLQNFVDSGNLIGRGYHGFTAEQLQGFAERVRPFFGAVELRGID